MNGSSHPTKKSQDLLQLFFEKKTCQKLLGFIRNSDSPGVCPSKGWEEVEQPCVLQVGSFFVVVTALFLPEFT